MFFSKVIDSSSDTHLIILSLQVSRRNSKRMARTILWGKLRDRDKPCFRVIYHVIRAHNKPITQYPKVYTPFCHALFTSSKHDTHMDGRDRSRLVPQRNTHMNCMFIYCSLLFLHNNIFVSTMYRLRKRPIPTMSHLTARCPNNRMHRTCLRIIQG